MHLIKWKYFFVLITLAAVTGCGDSNSSAPQSTSNHHERGAKDYSLSIQARKLKNDKVVLSVGTNIPGKIELMASLNLSGQAPDDTYIGTSRRLKLSEGKARAVFDVSNLPTGRYEAQVTFYPRWGFRDKKSKSTGINKNLVASQGIDIQGSGESAQSVAKRTKAQKWVMKNVAMGTPWKPENWKKRYGNWKELPVSSENPKIIKNYYFPEIDMTIVVNALKEEIVTWSKGKGGL